MADSKIGDSNPPHTGYRPLEEADFMVDTFEATNPEEKAAVRQDEIIGEIGTRGRIEYINGQPVLLPGRVPPQLSTQPSLPSYITDNLNINMSGKNDTEKKALAEGVIHAINEYLRDVNLSWDTTYEKLTKKLRLNPQYLGSTLYNIWLLRNGGDLAISSSLSVKPDREDGNNVLIDYSNLKLVLQYRCSPPKVADDSLAQEIIDWIELKMPDKCSRIIISIQENDKQRKPFERFYAKLQKKYGEKHVRIIVGSDGSSYDDLNIAYIVTNLLPLSKKYIISNDKFDDLKSIANGYKETIFKNTDKLKLIKLEDFCISTGNTYTESGETRGPGSSRPGSSSGFSRPGSSRDDYDSRRPGPSRGGPIRHGPSIGGPSPYPYPPRPARDPYPPGRDPYPPGRDPYPPGRDPYPPGRDPYPPRPALDPYPPRPALDPYPPGRDPYPPGRGPYPPGRGPYPPGRGPYPSGRGPYGGTNKNKKSLLNKYTRKVKKLHKKRIPTKKVVKKYSKNYKNYKKKTLKRKHK
jgi:hypothetical protein